MAEKKEKFVEKIIKFDISPFNYDLVVVVSDSVTKSRANRNELLGFYEPDEHHAAMHCWVGHMSYIFLPYAADIGSVAHEVFHFVWRLMQWIGAEHNNEVMAYHQGHYTREIAKFAYESTPVTKIPSNVQTMGEPKVKIIKKKPTKKKPLTKRK